MHTRYITRHIQGRLDEHHAALLRCFASLALLYKTLDLLTYLGTMFSLGPFRCYADLIWPAGTLFVYEKIL